MRRLYKSEFTYIRSLPLKSVLFVPFIVHIVDSLLAFAWSVFVVVGRLLFASIAIICIISVGRTWTLDGPLSIGRLSATLWPLVSVLLLGSLLITRSHPRWRIFAQC